MGTVKTKDVPNLGIKEETISEFLQCTFTEEERKDFSLDLARKTRDLEQLKLKKAEVTKMIGADIASVEATINKLAVKVNDGYEYRHVKCTVTTDYKNRCVTIVRNDTGEHVKDRPLSDEERQLALVK